MTTENLQSLSTMEKTDPYSQWQAHEDVRIIGGLYCPDVGTVELGPWPRKGCLGAILNLDGFNGNPRGNDLHIIEMGPGGKANPERHMYEEIVYVYSGSGATSVWFKESAKQTFEWHTGSLFVIPLNANYQHFNGSGMEPARLMSVTTAPHVLRYFHFNEEFIYQCPICFTDRFGWENYFNAEGVMWRSHANRVWESNFIPDAKSIKLYVWNERGGGSSNVMLQMGEGNLLAHISGFQVGTYKKAHIHGSTAYLFILNGKGFSLVWQEGQERIKCDWKPGSIFMTGAGGGEWYHQHFNAGPEPARYLALRGGFQGSFKYGRSSGAGQRRADVSIKKGGIQVEFEDEDPEVHRIFESELRTNNTVCKMKNLSPHCTGVTGPTSLDDTNDE